MTAESTTRTLWWAKDHEQPVAVGFDGEHLHLAQANIQHAHSRRFGLHGDSPGSVALDTPILRESPCRARLTPLSPPHPLRSDFPAIPSSIRGQALSGTRRRILMVSVLDTERHVTRRNFGPSPLVLKRPRPLTVSVTYCNTSGVLPTWTTGAPLDRRVGNPNVTKIRWRRGAS